MEASDVIGGVAWACIGAVLYSYALYPFVLAVLAGAAQLLRDTRYVLRKQDRRPATGELLPVAIVISAYNEEVHLQERIDNLLALDYPPELLHVYIGSDGSRDRTGEILRACRDARVSGFVFSANRGKASVLNDLVAKTSEPIVAFSDANTFFDHQALRRLLPHFADPRVAGVSGELRLIGGGGGDNQDSLYWRVEQVLKFFESRIGALLGANGAIYAIRREHWRPLAPDTVCDDFCIAMTAAAAGGRLVYEPAAFAHEETPAHIADEYGRRVRIGIGNFQALFRHPEYLFGISVGTAFAYLSHKVLRWLAPHLLAIGLAASLWLARDSSAWALFAAGQIGAYLLAALLYGASRSGRRMPGLCRIAAFLFALNWAFMIASFRYATGRYSGSWRRTSR